MAPFSYKMPSYYPSSLLTAVMQPIGSLSKQFVNSSLHPFLLSVYVMEAYSKPLVLSFPNICFGFALKSWMSLPPPQFHRMTPIVQFCLIWEDILEQSGEGSHNSSACYVKLLAGRKFHQQPWWCLVTVTWRNTATDSALQRLNVKAWLLLTLDLFYAIINRWL